MLKIYIAVIVGIFSCSVSQLLLKVSARRKHRSKIFELLNPLVTTSYIVLFTTLLVNIWAMSNGVQLKEIAILESLGYVFVPILSWAFLKEKCTMRAMMAMVLIVSGILVFYL